MKITMSLKKIHRQDIVAIRNHNERSDGGHAEPRSVLPEHLWLGKNTSKENQGVIERALGLAKRKDAVIAQSFLFQVGNQKDWRNDDGTPKKKPPIDTYKFFKECMRFIKEKYGAENVVRWDVHMDESSPHFSIWVTPIKNGKLAQKSFIDGAPSMSIFRKDWEDKIMSAFQNDGVSLKRGVRGEGGKPHDPGKSDVLKNYLSSFPDPVEFEIVTQTGGVFKKAETKFIKAVPISALEKWKTAATMQITKLIEESELAQSESENERVRAELALEALKKAQDELAEKTLGTTLPMAENANTDGFKPIPGPSPSGLSSPNKGFNPD